MKRYYHLTSDGPDTNLQLHSLRQAYKYWEALKADVAAEPNFVVDFHERCVFVVCTMGLSVSQLLGQNVPVPTVHVPSPTKIFQSIVREHRLDESLLSKFAKFIEIYDQCRHFGLTTDGTRHHQVSQVELAATEEHFNFGLEVWRQVINVYRTDRANDLEELDLEHLLTES